MAAAVFVCAHGAGGHMNDRAMLATAAALEPLGIEVVRFNFPYRERGSRRPDPMPALRERYEAVVAETRKHLGARPLIIGGRSMGGRVATMLAADGFACDALLLFAYPLHPAGQPEKLRDAHLPRIRVPVLCFNGTRDALCRRDLMERALQTVTAPWRMHWLEGADHSLKGEKVMQEIAAAVADWLPTIQRAA
ncbi:MAG: alpha/beta fold hydrolase [Betaproteobacteria bacterium]|nr:MAG: alpha/beta fold hydrolase [Betaproteobacteria bacterium]